MYEEMIEKIKPKLITLTELCYKMSISRKEREALVDGVISQLLNLKTNGYTLKELVELASRVKKDEHLSICKDKPEVPVWAKSKYWNATGENVYKGAQQELIDKNFEQAVKEE